MILSPTPVEISVPRIARWEFACPCPTCGRQTPSTTQRRIISLPEAASSAWKAAHAALPSESFFQRMQKHGPVLSVFNGFQVLILHLVRFDYDPSLPGPWLLSCSNPVFVRWLMMVFVVRPISLWPSVTFSKKTDTSSSFLRGAPKRTTGVRHLSASGKFKSATEIECRPPAILWLGTSMYRATAVAISVNPTVWRCSMRKW